MQKEKKFTAKNGIEIVIRPANPDDSCAILNTVRSNAMERSYVLMEQYGKNIDAEKEYISGLDPKSNLLIVAATRDNLVGCLAALQADAGMRPETRHIAHIGLHLSEPFRGLGIGQKLLEYSIEWAIEAGFKKLEANIFTTNRRSLHLFSKAGFAEEGVRKNSIRIGANFVNEVLMGKMLQTQAGSGEETPSLHRGVV
jgi:L-amino acid N-acyltransferase YncA